ncbi:RTX toxin [Proteus vulgaris]|uniref:RTX toxin n=1 Tax=Proteus vulgaris TaxID=585 RepID=UPI0018E4C5CD|nr:RTX toxin [Proteus vulgaris]MBI6542007.1 RTX toxin [Proteus vulgaris]
MNGFRKLIFKDDINRIALIIENHIKEHSAELFCKFESVKRVLTENYTSILISKNEYEANEFLRRIENNFSLYNKNEFTKSIDFVRVKINLSIENLFLNSAKLTAREPIKIKKERMNTLLFQHSSGTYYVELENKKLILEIDNESDIFKTIDFEGESVFFYSKGDLINSIENTIKKNNNNDFLYYRNYNKKEYSNYFNLNEYWNVSNNDIINEIIIDIKIKKQIDIDARFSIELNESFSYKNIFIIRDKIEKTEKVLHIYTDDIEEAFTIAKYKYSQIPENGEHLIYKVGTGWFTTKIKNNIVKRFSQSEDLLKPLEKIMSRINLIASKETNYDFSHVQSLTGLCYGLSLSYLLEIRNSGLEGGHKYLFWLKENISSYQNEKEIILNKLDSILFNNIQEYEVLNLMKEVKNIIFAQYFQMERLCNKVQYFVFDLLKSVQYNEVLNKKGLGKSNIHHIGFSQEEVSHHIDRIIQGYNDYYAIIAFKDHVIAIAYKKYSENNYKFTLFDSNSELLEFSDPLAIKEVLASKMDFYGAHEIEGKKYITFDEYKKTDSLNYRSVWNNDDVDINKGIAESIKKIGFSLPFSEGVTGRVIHYSEQRDLILQLKKENVLIEVVVKNSYVDEGIYLVKHHINDILGNNQASKIILNKNDDNSIDIDVVEFNNFQEIKKRNGYVEFNDIYYRDLIEINSYLVKGNKSKELKEIVSLIDILNGNIYFDKLTASFSLINKINLFNYNKNVSLIGVLNKVKNKLEDKLFYDRLIYGKEKLISLAEKNSLVAAKLYQLMVNEINDGSHGVSNFIYNQIIESPYLLLDKNRNAGVEGYDYTIEFKNNYQYLIEIIEHIDIPELKNTFLIEDNNKLHLKENYQKLSKYRDNEDINKLLNLIEIEIDVKKGNNLSSYHELYFDYFRNNQFSNRMIVHEINQLETYFNNNYCERNYGYHPNNFYVNEENIHILFDKSLNQNRNKIDCSYLLFDDNKDNFNFLFDDKNLFNGRNIDNIIIDSIDAYYQDDIIIYFYNGVKSEGLNIYLNDKPEISDFLDYCLKNKIRIIATGNEEDSFFQQDFIRQKNDVEKLHNIILENQFFNEKTIVFAKKEKLLSYQSGDFFIEGIAQRLNMPIYQIIDNKVSLLIDNIIVKPLIERQYIDKPLLASVVSNNVIISEAEFDDFISISIEEKISIENKNHTKEIYQLLSNLYPNYRDNEEFKLGYNKDIKTVIFDYSDNITISDVLDYIKLNHYNLNIYQIGTIINKVDHLSVEQHREILKELSQKIISNDISISTACRKYLYELSSFFKTSDENNIEKKLTQVIHDPLVNKKFNQYLMSEMTYQQWLSLDSLSEEKLTLTKKTNQAIEIIHAVYDNPTLIKKLSLLSKNLLTTFFDKNKKGILYRVLLDNISTFENYKKIINKLQNIIFMTRNKMILESSSPEIALKKASDLNSSDILDVKDKIFDYKNKEIIKINDFFFDKSLLVSLGAKVSGKNIDDIDLSKIEKWDLKLTFDPYHLNDYFLSISGSEKDKKVISLFRYLLNNKEEKIKYLLSNDVNRIDYLAASERLTKMIKLGNKGYSDKDWNLLRNASLTLPRHMKIISKIGYANITYGMWQSINSTFMLAEQLNNPLLSPKERKEIINNLAIMWSEMAYNGLSELIEITLAKGLLKYRHNPLEYVSKISTKVGIGLNVLSIGFDIYNAYDNFSRISGENNEKRKIDYIVNGSFAVVSGLVTLGVSIAMLAGSTIAGPIGIVAGAVIALATSIYNAARLIEEAKTKVNFTPLEELNNGFYAFLMGDLLPNKKNEIIYLETETQLEEMIDKNAVNYLDEIKKQNHQSRYFYTNEKQVYQEYYYYKVIPNLMGKTLDSILNPLGEYVAQRISQNISQEVAEKIAALSYHLRSEKTEYKYYLPKEAIATHETLIFDVDFYVNELNRYTMDIISDDDSPIFDNIVDSDFLKNIRTNRENIINVLGVGNLSESLIKANKYKKYYVSDWNENEKFYFNTYHGNDVIAAPLITQNTFDIYNGTKRLSGGERNDMFNLFSSESPLYASRFYGREGNDTLRIIKTTNKYTGYEVSLSNNYVKFRQSEEQTNSKNFHSKLFLYQENGRLYSKQLVDSMPNIVLQDQNVIAYLDSIENVIGSEAGDDIIYGNQENNYLEGAGGTDLLYGLGGNDTLVLREGYAEGGEGNDSYVILRSSLEKNYNIQFQTIINEVSHIESSIVQLNYHFDEIAAISRQGKDIIFDIKVNDGNENNELIYHSIKLKNVYDDSVSNTLSHCYTLITQDGFLLTLDENTKDKILYKFSYLEQYNKSKLIIKDFYINEIEKLIITAFKSKSRNIKLLPEFEYSGFLSGTNLRLGIHGNNQNNNYFGIDSNSYIKLSQGNDNYQIKTFLTKNKNERVNILLSDYIDKLTDDNVSHFFLTDISGFDLTFKDGLLSHRYLPDDYLTLSFDPTLLNKIVDTNVTIRLIDKDNVVFTLPTKESQQHLLTPMTDLNFTISAGNDVLMIPESLTLNKEALSTYSLDSPYSLLRSILMTQQKPHNQSIEHLPILELMAGDDIVVNHNKCSSVIDGGEGDDHIVVNHGHHILIAREGNDNLSAGSGNDLLISESGLDYLSGGSGSNIYIVNKRYGEVTIYDEGENSQLFISGLSEHDELISSQVGDDWQYRTEDGQFILTLKTKENQTNSSVTIIKTENTLSMQSLASIIQEMAQFNEQQLTTMQGSEFIPSPTWSPLSLVAKHL